MFQLFKTKIFQKLTSLIIHLNKINHFIYFKI